MAIRRCYPLLLVPVLLLASGLGSIVVAADDLSRHLGPVSCAELSRRWTERYVRDFGLNGLARESVDCRADGRIARPAARATVLALALHDVESAGAGRGSDFYAFLSRRVRSIEVAPEGEPECPEEAVAVSFPLARDRFAAGTLLICPAYFGSDVNPEHRAATLVHEARHFDIDDPGHVLCDDGAYANLGQGCDEFHPDDLLAGSGYHYALAYFLAVLDRPEVIAAERERVKRLIGWTLRNRFNGVPAGWKPPARRNIVGEETGDQTDRRPGCETAR